MKVNIFNFKMRPSDEYWGKIDSILRSNQELLMVMSAIIVMIIVLSFSLIYISLEDKLKVFLAHQKVVY